MKCHTLRRSLIHRARGPRRQVHSNDLPGRLGQSIKPRRTEQLTHRAVVVIMPRVSGVLCLVLHALMQIPRRAAQGDTHDQQQQTDDDATSKHRTMDRLGITVPLM